MTMQAHMRIATLGRGATVEIKRVEDRSPYRNGYVFGLAYGRNYGLRSLMASVRRDAASGERRPVLEYVKGEIDAALAIAQGV
jgi:hypothetical protein